MASVFRDPLALDEKVEMSYRVLARAYRSQTFDEVVGQEAIATTLKNAIKAGRVHHGYLFTGTRGVGKTSMARILAKALNCLSADAPTVTPCGTCESCKSVAEGEDVDVVEIDAASNTGVDNIRELRANAAYRPTRARFKVYIVDEVHMLSAGAFNALLKTLEEPPTHVKFILATTDPQKVPATIQSRCQRFDFRAIDASDITKHLQQIVTAEDVTADESVLRRVARLANGSMRDALSLLDKLLSYESKHLTPEIAADIIPPPHDELASAVIEAVGRQDAAAALRALDGALQSGRTIERFCGHLIDHVRTLMLLRVCGEDTDLVDATEQVRPNLIAQSMGFDAPTYVYMITMLEELRRNVKFSGAARALVDAAVVRLAMSQQFSDIGSIIDQLGDAGSASAILVPGQTAKKKVAGEVGLAASPIGDSGRHEGRRRESSEENPDAETQTTPRRAVSSPSSTNVDSKTWKKVASDPLVERVRSAVEGTLHTIRPDKRSDEGDRPSSESEELAERD